MPTRSYGGAGRAGGEVVTKYFYDTNDQNTATVWSKSGGFIFIDILPP